MNIELCAKSSVSMKISGVITIYPTPGADIVLAGDKTLADLNLGPCVHWGDTPDEVKQFSFEGENVDINRLASRLVTFKKNGRFDQWYIVWYMRDDAEAAITGGLVGEDAESGAIVTAPLLGLRGGANRGC